MRRVRRDLGEGVDDLLGHAVAEVFVLGVRAEIGERQNGDRGGPLLLPVGGAKLGLERLAQRPERLALRVFFPVVEIRRVHGTKVDRQACVLEANGHQRSPVGGIARLAADPSRVDGGIRPDDDQGAGGVEFPGDQGVEFFAWSDLRVPPYGPPLVLERGYERRDAGLVLPRIGNKYVGQGRPRRFARL